MYVKSIGKCILKSSRWLQRNSRVFATKKSDNLSVSDTKISSTQNQSTMNVGYNFEYLMRMDKTHLAYRAIRLQRKLDSFMKTSGVMNIDGRDKV